MAIVSCKECSHKVSDQATRCPSCGVAINERTKRRAGRGIAQVVAVAAAFCLIATALWFLNLTEAARLFSRSATTGAGSDHAAVAPTARREESATPRTVYQTTAEQLSRDYSTNGVAAQSRIGNGGTRVGGTVTAIEEDAAGLPVVKLATNRPSSVDLTLNRDQTAAAAMLSSGQHVEIQCDSMHGSYGLPVGSGCSLALVTASLAAPAAPALDVRQPVLATASRVQLEKSPPRVEKPPRAASAAKGTRAQMPAAIQRSADPQPLQPAVLEPTPAPAAVPVTVGVAPAQLAASVSQPVVVAPPDQPSAKPTTPVAPPVAAPAVAPATASVAPDDLAAVRQSDPDAAGRIDSYCAKSNGATDNASFAAGCRREEKDAWTRFVVNNEFPTLDEATRGKCNEPPFPDSYVAKETCARYLLSVKTSTAAQR